MDLLQIPQLEDQLVQLIRDDRLTSAELKLILLDEDSILAITGDRFFLDKLEEIFEILTSDIDGDGKITVHDLQVTLKRSLEDLENIFMNVEDLLLMDNAKVGIRLLENLLLIIHGIQEQEIYLDLEKLELLLFKILIYFLIEFLPHTSQRDYRPETKIILIRMVGKLLQRLRTMHLLTATIGKIRHLFGKKKCSCWPWCRSNDTNSRVQQRRFQQKLIGDARLVGAKIAQKKQIATLESQVKALQDQLQMTESSDSSAIVLDLPENQHTGDTESNGSQGSVKSQE